MPLFYAFFLLEFYFIIGAAAFAYIARRKKASKSIWTKYWVYWLLTHVLVASLVFQPVVFKAIAVFIAFFGFYEVLDSGRKYLSNKSQILSISVYLIVSTLFLSAIYSAKAPVLLYIYLLVITFDAFSQIFGQWLGKNLMFPKISPGKTWEGFIGGLLTTLLTALFVNQFLHISPLEKMLLPVLICIGALIGDLAASYFKRLCGIKDFPEILPGHGGILDRFDSFLGAVSILAAYLIWK